MIAGWIAIAAALAYSCALFALAYWGDHGGRRLFRGGARGPLYALGLCIYCTSWTFFGSVGLAATGGFDFVPVYLGPILVFAFGHRAISRIVRISKAGNITTVADFVSARYGRSEGVAALVAAIAVIGAIPYLALQIKAICQSLAVVSGSAGGGAASPGASFAVAALLGLFAIAFGTRRLDATEHRSGLMLAVGVESLVKLAAFLAVGAFVVFGMFAGPADLYAKAAADPAVRAVFHKAPDPASWIAITLLSACATLLLPRQFHAAVVENRSEGDVRRAAVAFPLYLVAINLFVAPIAAAGLLVFPGAGADRDFAVLALPLHAGAPGIALVALIGGLSAAAAMVFVACTALSVMICNDLVVPLLLRWRALRPQLGATDIAALILRIRRASIAALMLLAWLYLGAADEAALAAIGLLAFAAIAQIAPAFAGGLVWRRATARGAAGGMLAGIAVWALALLLPALADGGAVAAAADLKPQMHAALLSLLANAAAFVALSLSRAPSAAERAQAEIFVGGIAMAPPPAFARPAPAAVALPEIEAIVARHIGRERARAAFAELALAHARHGGGAIELEGMRLAEQMLAGAIGAASARLALSLALQRRDVPRAAALGMLDEASAALRQNHQQLQHAIDFAQQGFCIFDADLRLAFWNRQFCEIFGYPAALMRPGVALADLVRHDAQRGLLGAGPAEEAAARRIELLTGSIEPFRLPIDGGEAASGVIEVRTSRMPDGGLVITYTDVSQQVEAEQALAAINETLEQRVRERTDELEALNSELVRAKALAEDANLSKTRFLAAASHDILQPLNAARLFATALAEKAATWKERVPGASDETVNLARNIDASLQAVEDILTALLDMSRLDAGAMKPEVTAFRIDDILSQLKAEFAPLAANKGLELVFAPCSLAVRSDRRLLRRLLQNLVSNAIKYTVKGTVLVGCRRRRGRLRIEVWDTGLGIPDNKRKAVFREFERLDNAAGAHGLGLGLSIVERLGRVLGHRIALRSWPGRGSVFSVELPAAPVLPAALARAAPGPERHQPLAGLVVLAIDDEPRILEGMTALLQGWGCEVMAAAGLKQAEEMAASRRLAPQVVIADYHLGAELGIDVIVQLRWKFGPGLPAVLLTADRSQSVRLEAGLKDIALLNKPIKPAALRALLAQWHVTRVAAE